MIRRRESAEHLIRLIVIPAGAETRNTYSGHSHRQKRSAGRARGNWQSEQIKSERERRKKGGAKSEAEESKPVQEFVLCCFFFVFFFFLYLFFFATWGQSGVGRRGVS